MFRASTLLSAALVAGLLSSFLAGQSEAVAAAAATTVSCDSSLEGPLTGCETGCGATNKAAGIQAVSKAIAGGVALKCKGCPDDQEGCVSGYGGTNIQISFFVNPQGQQCVTICAGGGGNPSTARFSCSECKKKDDDRDGD